MSDQDIFQEDKKEELNTAPDQSAEPKKENPEVQDPYVDQLKKIVRETGEPKYSSVTEALKALESSQSHIPNLERDNETLRKELSSLKEELAKKSGALDALDRFAHKQDEPTSRPAQQGLDEGAVAGLIESVLSKKQQAELAKANLKSVTTVLREKFGDKAGEAFYSRAEELGLSKQEMNSLAERSPKAVLSYFGEFAKPSVKTNTSSINTAGLAPQEKPKGNLPPPSKSVMAGATTNDLVEEMRRHRLHINEKYGITQ